jgi:soluble lytic murein transglycosylase-like protein
LLFPEGQKRGFDMMQVKEGLSLNLTFADGQLTKPGIPTSKYSGNTSNPIFIQRSSYWQSAALSCLILLLGIAVCAAFFAFYRVSEANREHEHAMGRVEKKIQQLEAGVSFDSKRQQILLAVRDEIMRTNPNVSLVEAYHYAELVILASDKYPSVDPLIFLSIGIVESAYDNRATSHANARGLYQIWPSTGRLLARTLDWEYNEDMLYDPAKNTEMAALYLDILFAAYNDIDMVLAEYNGGPLNAGYFRAGSDRAAAETREYVHKVKDTYRRLLNKFERGIDLQMHPMHREKNRRGKKLGVRAIAENHQEKVMVTQ